MDLLKAFLIAEEVTNEAELDPEALERLTSEFLGLAEERLGAAIPTDPMRQLRSCGSRRLSLLGKPESVRIPASQQIR